MSVTLALLLVAHPAHPTSATSVCRPEVAHWEFTQAMQDDNNSIDLFDQRATTLRLYFKLSDPLACQQHNPPITEIPDVTAELRTSFFGQPISCTNHSQSGCLPDDPHDSVNVSGFEWNRSDRSAPGATKSLEYTFTPNLADLPYGSLGGIVYFEACPHPAGQQMPCEQWDSTTAYFEAARIPPAIAAFGVDYTYGPYNGTAPRSNTAPGTADTMVRGIYPISRGSFYWFPDVPPIKWSQDLSSYHNLGQNPSSPYGAGYYNPNAVELADAISVAAFCHTDFWSDYGFGWLKNADPPPLLDYNGIGFPAPQASGYALGTDYAKTTYLLAHELGHMAMDWIHSGLDLQPDTGWDVLNVGRLGSRMRLPTQCDVMNIACGTVRDSWITTAHYEQARTMTHEATIPPVPVDVMRIAGGIGIDGSWSLARVLQVSRPQAVPTPSPVGSARVRLLDGQQREIYSSRFDPQSYSDPVSGQSHPVGFVEVVPATEQADVIEIYDGDQLKVSRTRSPHAPAVTVTDPKPGDVIGPNTVVRWQASDADGDQLTAIVLYSKNGTSWAPLAIAPPNGELPLETGYLACGTSAAIRVLVTDGMNTTQQEVSGLHLVCNRPPAAVIVQPPNNAVYDAGANVTFQGIARDPEDGWIAPASMTWRSSLDGVLGQGDLLNLGHLSRGIHAITLSVVDSEGTPSSSTATIEVQ